MGKTYFAAGGKAATLYLGQTAGVMIGDDREFTRTPSAMEESATSDGLVNENSVHTSLARRDGGSMWFEVCRAMLPVANATRYGLGVAI